MPPHTDEPMEEPRRGQDLDPRTAEALEEAYASRIGLDTAARHLWVLYRSAGAMQPNEGQGQQEEPATEAGAESGKAKAGLARARQVAVSVLTCATILATSGAAVAASDSSLPGDTLYALKRGTEQVRLVFAAGSGTEGQMRVALARERWSEAKRAAIDRPDVVAELVRDAVQALEAAERSDARVAEAAGSFRRQLVDESPTVAADLASHEREDVQASLNRLADGRDVADADGRGGEVTATDDKAGGDTVTVPADGDDETAPQDGRSGANTDGAEPQPGSAGDEDADSAGGPEDAGAEEADDQAAGKDGDAPDTAGEAAGDAAEEALGQVPVGEQPVPPEGKVVPPDGDGLELAEDARREAAAPEGEGRQPDGAGAAEPQDDGRQPEPGEGHNPPASSPTLSPDQTQQRVTTGGG